MIPPRKGFTTFEDRSPLYDDVRLLLNPGFLSASVLFNGIQISLRTLNSDDFFLIETRSGLQTEEWFEWFLATSIWVFDGQILEREQEAVVWLHKMLKMFPFELKKQLSLATTLLTKRFFRARERALSYFYERESRDLWGGRGTKLFDNSFAWVGRNSIQDLWVYYNRTEDLRLQRMFEQNMHAFSVSPHAPKSIKKINDRMKSDERILEIERSVVQDKMYFAAFNIEFEDNRFLRQGFDHIEVAITYEDLERQMKDYFEGKKDQHDLVVDEIRQRMIARKRRQEELREQRRREAQKLREQYVADDEGSQVLVGKEAEEFIRRMQEESKRPNVGFVVEDDRSQVAFKKHIEQEIQVPNVNNTPLTEEERNLAMQMLSQNPHGGVDLSKGLSQYKPRI